MRMSLMISCLGPCLAVLAAAVWSLPLIQRLRRIPQVLVPLENKEKDALRIGILGASFIARAAVVHAADKRRDVLVAAVAARSETKAKNFAQKHGIPAFHGGATAYADLLGRSDVDAVYIGLPTELHLEWTLAALRAGKHVLLEKPSVLNAEEAHQLLEAMRETRRLVFEAAHHRYHPAARRFKQLLTSSKIETATETAPFVDVRFSMVDPRSLFNSIRDSLLSRSLSSEERQYERIKNLDRWWYCVDMLLWSTGANNVEVLFAKEERFGLSATLKLRRQNHSTVARISMARDSWRDPFTWTIAAGNRTSSTDEEVQPGGSCQAALQSKGLPLMAPLFIVKHVMYGASTAREFGFQWSLHACNPCWRQRVQSKASRNYKVCFWCYISAAMISMRSQASLRLQNFGFPFLWHRLDFMRVLARRFELGTGWQQDVEPSRLFEANEVMAKGLLSNSMVMARPRRGTHEHRRTSCLSVNGAVHQKDAYFTFSYLIFRVFAKTWSSGGHLWTSYDVFIFLAKDLLVLRLLDLFKSWHVASEV